MRFAFQLIKHRERVKFITKTNIRYYSTTFVFIYTISGWASGSDLFESHRSTCNITIANDSKSHLKPPSLCELPSLLLLNTHVTEEVEGREGRYLRRSLTETCE